MTATDFETFNNDTAITVHAADSKLYFIPWGIDDAFGRGNPLRGEDPTVSPLLCSKRAGHCATGEG